MKKTGIAELKNNLSRYLDQVKGGESILVLDRNQPVAQIVPLQKGIRGAAGSDDRLARLERKGLIGRGLGGPAKWINQRPPVKVRGSVLKDLREERRSGW